MLLGLLVLLFCGAARAAEAPPVYVSLWFDTEDYIDPAADDAALRIALDLERLGVRATFKVVGEKARVLEARGRSDVIRALARHDIGYHSENHSVPPTPAVYLRELGYFEGALEFQRREGRGAEDVRRIFGMAPSCYGQPGSSWGPQSNLALRRMGIPVYLDEGSQVTLDEQPFWYGGLLYVFGLGRFTLRASLAPDASLDDALRKFDSAAADLRRRGGGLISIYYHPTEFVTTEFWDGVNFPRGAGREPAEWKLPRHRTADDAQRCYSVLRTFVEQMKQRPGVRFVTAREFPQLYRSQDAPRVSRDEIRKHLSIRITFLRTADGAISPAQMLLVLLNVEPAFVEGPSARKPTTYTGKTIPRAAFERAKSDAAGFIRTHKALPAAVWVGSSFLSLADFTATLASDDGASLEVPVLRGELAFEKHFAQDARRAFGWAIHPEGFAPEELLELGRLQGWTLKPAQLNRSLAVAAPLPSRAR
jgi:hypothetical protein